jgi:tetratricopeptide (TPR) repeat protein
MRTAAALTLAILLSIQLACTSEAGPADQSGPLTSIGIVDDGAMDSRQIWFVLSQIDQRFVVDTAAVPDVRGFFGALLSSSETNRSVHVSFDPSSGDFLDGGDTPSYVVRSIEYDGRVYAGMTGTRRTGNPINQSESALALAVAYYSGGFPERALAPLDAVLSRGELRPSLRALAHETRGNAITDHVHTVRQTPTDEDDAQFMRALEDFRAWSALQPESMDARVSIGYALRDLGAYEEALMEFESIYKRWPDYSINAVTRIGATYRTMGDLDRALATLDELVKREGPQEGMKFHYHRGWTFNEMGRYEEAVAEFTAGLTTQPDYSGAFDRRACAYAMSGRLPEALADRQHANALLKAIWNDTRRTPYAEHDLAWGEAVVRSLEAAIAEGSREPMSTACEGAWNYGERRRERSKLLPR